MPRIANSATTLLLILIASTAHGHGYLKFPRSRNFVAYEDGKSWTNDPEIPSKEDCPHCLARNEGACGITGRRDYKIPKNYLGDPMQLNIQWTYDEGDIIELEVVLTAHHMGHFEYSACPLSSHGEIPTSSCFDSHKLEFVEDVLYDAPKDPTYPDRAYIAPRSVINSVYGGQPYGMIFRHRYVNIRQQDRLRNWFKYPYFDICPRKVSSQACILLGSKLHLPNSHFLTCRKIISGILLNLDTNYHVASKARSSFCSGTT